MNSKVFYLSLTVFFASLTATILLPVGELGRALAALPAVGAVFGALFQLFRDQLAHDRALLLQEAQNSFSVGATSHMANVAFDKYTLFCEEYVQEIYKALLTLFRKGPIPEVLQHADALYMLQQKYAVWLTTKLERDLELFESALRRIGANAQYVNNSPGAEDREQRITAMYKTFADVMGAEHMGSNEWDGKKLTEELAVSIVIRRLRAVLGTEEFTEMRAAIVSKAISGLRNTG